MRSQLTKEISDEEVAAFERDGVVCLRNVFDDTWIRRMREAADAVLSRKSELLELTEGGGRLSVSQFLWMRDDTFQDYLFKSPAAALGARLLRASRVSVLYDEFIVKEPGTPVPVSWHQDGPSWPIRGAQALTLWMPLDSTTVHSGGMRYAKGLHRGKVYSAYINTAGNAPGVTGIDGERCPDFDTMAEDVEILSWDVEPGDCLAHHMHMPHMTGPNQAKDMRRRAHTTRWIGEQCTFREGNFQIQRAWVEKPGVKEGEPVISNHFPQVPFHKGW